jgi:hypothetical protein
MLWKHPVEVEGITRNTSSPNMSASKLVSNVQFKSGQRPNNDSCPASSAASHLRIGTVSLMLEAMPMQPPLDGRG